MIALSLKSYSDSTPQCSDSDCTFEFCKAAKRSNEEKISSPKDDSNSHYNPSAKRLNTNSYTLRDDIRNKEAIQRTYNKFLGSASNANSVLRVPPGFEWRDAHFSNGVQQIPPLINQDNRLGLNDVQLFANVMRAGRRNIGNNNNFEIIINSIELSIDTTYVDVVGDPIVAQFLWNTIGTPVLDNYPDLLYLRQQLGRRIKDILEKHSRDSFNLVSQRNTNKLTINDLPHINQILLDSNSRPKQLDENAFGIDRTSMYKCRRSDPYMATIQTAIYSEPQPLPVNFHKAAEDFALLSHPNNEAIVDETTIKAHGKQFESRNIANVFSFKPNAATFKPTLSSTPIKNHSLSAENKVIPSDLSNFPHYPTMYTHVPCSNLFVPWYNNQQQNSVYLYPQTLLMSSPKAPRVYPDLTNE